MSRAGHTRLFVLLVLGPGHVSAPTVSKRSIWPGRREVVPGPQAPPLLPAWLVQSLLSLEPKDRAPFTSSQRHFFTSTSCFTTAPRQSITESLYGHPATFSTSSDELGRVRCSAAPDRRGVGTATGRRAKLARLPLASQSAAPPTSFFPTRLLPYPYGHTTGPRNVYMGMTVDYSSFHRIFNVALHALLIAFTVLQKPTPLRLAVNAVMFCKKQQYQSALT